MGFSADEVQAGQAVYTPRLLRRYDLLVLTLSNPLIWRCPTGRLRRFYERHATANHLDVGVGSGYFPDRCQFPAAAPRVGLLDLNEHALAHAAKRIARYGPELYRGNVLEPIPYSGEPFDSVALNYVLHCLPGALPAKSVVFDHLRPWLRPGGTLFGSTLLQGGVHRGWAARRLMAAYHRRGIFSNELDTLDDLHQQLSQRFRDVTLEVVGCAALFSGRT